jgi:hypothetical protein
MKTILRNLFDGPVATAIGLITAICQTGEITQAFPVIIPYCGLIASLALLFARFKPTTDQ